MLFPCPTPLKNYPSRKSGNGVYQTILNRLPSSPVLLSPFLGSGPIELFVATSKNHWAGTPTQVYCADISPVVLGAWYSFQKPLNFHLNKMHFPEFFAVTADISTATMFIDPPYLKDSISPGANYYGTKFTNNDMRKLLKLCISSRHKIMICHPRHPLFIDMLKGWHSYEYTYQTRGGKKADCLWMNYNASTLKLFTYDFLGDNFKQRQNVTEKLYSLSCKFQALPYHLRERFLLENDLPF